MPNSLRCKIKHLRHNGTLTERECDRILKALEQQPCTDCISREAVLEQIDDWRKNEFLRVTNPLHYLRKRISSLPSVAPQPKVESEEEDDRD